MKKENDKFAYLTFTSSTYVRGAAPFKMIFLTKDIFKPIFPPFGTEEFSGHSCKPAPGCFQSSTTLPLAHDAN